MPRAQLFPFGQYGKSNTEAIEDLFRVALESNIYSYCFQEILEVRKSADGMIA